MNEHIIIYNISNTSTSHTVLSMVQFVHVLLLQQIANNTISEVPMEKHISKIQSYFDSNVPANRYTSTARGSAANIDSAEWNILSKLIES